MFAMNPPRPSSFDKQELLGPGIEDSGLSAVRVEPAAPCPSSDPRWSVQQPCDVEPGLSVASAAQIENMEIAGEPSSLPPVTAGATQ
jgi:hypothetical protein